MLMMVLLSSRLQSMAHVILKSFDTFGKFFSVRNHLHILKLRVWNRTKAFERIRITDLHGPVVTDCEPNSAISGAGLVIDFYHEIG